MSEPIQTYCNEGCQKPFTITKFRSMKVKKGIEKTYFRCSHCKHEYVAYYSSDETLKLQKKMRALHVKMRTTDIDLLNKLQIEEADLKAEIKKSMDEARAMATN